MKLLAHTYFGCSRSALAILWGFAVLCPSATYAWQEEDLAHAPPAQLRLIQEPPVRIDPIVVARGRLRGSFLKGPFQSATYSITKLLHGEFKSGEIEIPFSDGTLNGRLPEDAILLFEYHGRETRYVNALGRQAWRGILPYTPEKWEELKQADPEKLSRNEPDKELPIDQAIALAEFELAKKGLQSTEGLRFDANRKGFGWVIQTLEPTEDEDRFRTLFVYYVSDEGRVLDELGPGFSSSVVVHDGKVFYR